MRANIRVPFGYEPPTNNRKGTLIYYDTFEQATYAELEAAARLASERSFARLVLYPLHEETVKRISKEPVSPYYKRADLLHDWKREQEESAVSVIIEGWESRRKKYTPLDTALRHLTESYPGPYFLLVTPETANLFAGFQSFDAWIVKLRLLLTEEPGRLHPKLEQYRSRWDVM